MYSYTNIRIKPNACINKAFFVHLQDLILGEFCIIIAYFISGRCARKCFIVTVDNTGRCIGIYFFWLVWVGSLSA